MKYTYLEDFTKTSADDLSLVQKTLSETRAIVDSKLFALIEEAEKGDYEVMAELYEIFTFGENDIQPNYELALRYCNRLNESNSLLEEPDIIFEGLNAKARLHDKFRKTEEAHTAYLKAFKYMVIHIDPKQWDKQIVNLVAEYVNGLEV